MNNNRYPTMNFTPSPMKEGSGRHEDLADAMGKMAIGEQSDCTARRLDFSQAGSIKVSSAPPSPRRSEAMSSEPLLSYSDLYAKSGTSDLDELSEKEMARILTSAIFGASVMGATSTAAVSQTTVIRGRADVSKLPTALVRKRESICKIFSSETDLKKNKGIGSGVLVSKSDNCFIIMTSGHVVNLFLAVQSTYRVAFRIYKQKQPITLHYAVTAIIRPSQLESYCSSNNIATIANINCTDFADVMFLRCDLPDGKVLRQHVVDVPDQAPSISSFDNIYYIGYGSGTHLKCSGEVPISANLLTYANNADVSDSDKLANEKGVIIGESPTRLQEGVQFKYPEKDHMSVSVSPGDASSVSATRFNSNSGHKKPYKNPELFSIPRCLHSHDHMLTSLKTNPGCSGGAYFCADGTFLALHIGRVKLAISKEILAREIDGLHVSIFVNSEFKSRYWDKFLEPECVFLTSLKQCYPMKIKDQCYVMLDVEWINNVVNVTLRHLNGEKQTLFIKDYGKKTAKYRLKKTITGDVTDLSSLKVDDKMTICGHEFSIMSVEGMRITMTDSVGTSHALFIGDDNVPVFSELLTRQNMQFLKPGDVLFPTVSETYLFIYDRACQNIVDIDGNIITQPPDFEFSSDAIGTPHESPSRLETEIKPLPLLFHYSKGANNSVFYFTYGGEETKNAYIIGFGSHTKHAKKFTGSKYTILPESRCKKFECFFPEGALNGKILTLI